MEDKNFVLFSDKLELRCKGAALAPLAGYSDIAMRLLCKEYGATLFFTEMISIKGIVYKSNNTEALLKTCSEDSPLVVQLFGNEGEIFEAAIGKIQELGFKYFDINMGCSVPKVVKTGAGAAMLKNMDNTLFCAEKIIKATGNNVGFKMRLGYETHNDIYKELALALAELGASYITLHPRYGKQGFTGVANWEAIKELKERLSIPVIASGDLLTAEQGLACLEETKADMLMYARGALHNPLIFLNHNLLLEGKATLPHSFDSAYEMIQKYAVLCKQYFPDKALLRMRTFVPRCLHFFHNVAHLRKALVQIHSWEAFDALIEEFYRIQKNDQ